MGYYFQTVASKLHNTEVEVEILQTKEECDHVQFLITEKNITGQRQNDQTAEVETLSQGHRRYDKLIFYVSFVLLTYISESKKCDSRVFRVGITRILILNKKNENTQSHLQYYYYYYFTSENFE